MKAWLASVFMLCASFAPSVARAHEGPPFPVIVDRVAGPYIVSVWADPDVGTGTFFVTFDPPVFSNASDTRVVVEVQPASRRLPPAHYDAHHQPDEAFRADVPFDREERWTVTLSVTGSRGDGRVAFDVNVTPPGYGRWDLLIYFTPFAVLGGLWLAVALKKRAMERARLAK